MKKDSETISVTEARLRLGIGRLSAYRGVHAGQIPSLRIGKLLRVPKAALNKMLAGESLQKDEVK